MSLTADIPQMTLQEKLLLMEALWDDLSRHEEDVPVSEWHRTLLKEREDFVATGEAKFMDWDEARMEIQALIRGLR